jgi:hypothetical protein
MCQRVEPIFAVVISDAGVLNAPEGHRLEYANVDIFMTLPQIKDPLNDEPV